MVEFCLVRQPVQMEIRDFKEGCGFIVEGASFGSLCSCLAGYPDVAFTNGRRFFWSAVDVRGKFSFHGHVYKIEPWDIDDSIFVTLEHAVDSAEIAALRDRVSQSFRRCRLTARSGGESWWTTRRWLGARWVPSEIRAGP